MYSWDESSAKETDELDLGGRFPHGLAWLHEQVCAYVVCRVWRVCLLLCAADVCVCVCVCSHVAWKRMCLNLCMCTLYVHQCIYRESRLSVMPDSTRPECM